MTRDPDSDKEVQLRWLDDGQDSRYTKTDKLTPSVASRMDLIEDYTHIEKLGEAVTSLTELDLTDCGFTAGSIAGQPSTIKRTQHGY